MGRSQPPMQTRITKQSPTSDDVETVKQLMQDRSPQCSSEQSEETLGAYYKRARSMMERVGA